MEIILSGRRTVPSALDDLAQTYPNRTWVQFLTDDQKLRQVSFARGSLAISTASWWLKDTLGNTSGFDTIAYLGPNDIRYLILFCAASKCGYKILFTSPRNSQDGHAKLLLETNCQAVLYDPTFGLQALALTANLKLIPVPSLAELLENQADRPLFPFEKSFDEARNDPCIVLHTSGTTSLPTPVVLTHGSLAVFDAQWRIHPLHDSLAVRETFVRTMASSSPFLMALPFSHMAGFSMGIWLPLNVDMRVVFTNGSRPLSLLSIEQVLCSMHIRGAIIPPSILEEAAKSRAALDKIARLRHVFYGGAPLSSAAGLAISSRTHLCNQIGSTECIVFTTHLTDRSDWDYLCFGSDWSRYEFRQCGTPGMFEMVIVRDENKREFQAIFQGTDLQEYPTRDMYSPHPVKPHHWKYQGRLDDVIVLANGEKLNPVSNEHILRAHPLLSSCMYVGNGRMQPAIILELADRDAPGPDSDQVITAVWPVIEHINALSPSHGQLQRSHVLVAHVSKRFCRTAKGTLKRLDTVRLFQEEIDQLYETFPRASTQAIASVDITHHDELLGIVRLTYQKACRTGAGSLQLDDDIFHAGADSLSIQGAVSTLKASLFSPGVSIDTNRVSQNAVYAHSTVRSMTDFLERLGHGGQGPPRDAIFLEHQEELQSVYDQYYRQLPSATSVTPAKTSLHTAILLTGSTGNLGTYLLDALLERDDVDEVICINRSPDAAERQLRSHGDKGLRTDFSRRNLKFLQADLSQPKFGLGASDFNYISSKTTIILHCQWPVNFNLPLSSFEPQLQGVVGLIDFAVDAACRPKIFFVSSISAVNNWPRLVHLKQEDAAFGNIPEQHITDLSLASRGYGQSKAIASDLLFCASSERELLETTIIRLGQLAGPATHDHGAWNSSEWLPMLIKTSQTLGALPRTIPLFNEVDWVPVDCAAQVVIELVLDVKPGPGRCSPSLFNVANPHTVPWETLASGIRSYSDNDLESIPYSKWLHLLEAKAMVAEPDVRSLMEELPALKMLTFFQDLERGEKNGAQQTFLSTNRTRKASRHLEQVRAVDVTMMMKWMEQWSLSS